MKDPIHSRINQYRIKKGPLGSTDDYGNNGAFVIEDGKKRLYMVVSDQLGWEHVSVHVKYMNAKGRVIERTPTWEEMCMVKRLFWKDDEIVVQYHPAKEDYINDHKHCLHLWRPTELEMPTPPSGMVGLKQMPSNSAVLEWLSKTQPAVYKKLIRIPDNRLSAILSKEKLNLSEKEIAEIWALQER